MMQISIQDQIKAIKKATAKATQSKEAALKFLVEAGIIQKGEKVQTKANKNK